MKTVIVKSSMNTILFFLMCFVCLTACREEESDNKIIYDECCLPKPTDTLYMSQELKSYFYFPIGSWWVYERTDTIAGIYDTAKVVRIINEIFYNEFAPYAWEKITVVVEHTYYPSPPNSVSPNLSVSFQNLNTLTDRIRIRSNGKYPQSLPDVLSVPIDSLSMALKSQESGGITELIDTSNVQIHNRLFDNVVHLNYGTTGFIYNLKFSKNVGLISIFDPSESTSWVLVNYQIN